MSAALRQLRLLESPPEATRGGDVDPLQMEARAPNRDEAAFDGESIEPELDARRLGRQLGHVLAALRLGGWWTLRELAAVAGGSEAGCSARLRDLRKARFGGYEVERRRRGDPKRGLFEYRLAPESGR